MEKIEIPFISERIRGVTPPKNGFIYICDYDEVHKLWVDGSNKHEVLDDDPYEFLSTLKDAVGVEGNSLLHEVNGHKVSYRFEPAKKEISVECTIKGSKSVLNFPIMSGDWFGASFSGCGDYLLVAEPYTFELYKL